MKNNNRADYLPQSELKELQLKRLRDTVARACGNVAPYREKMDAANVRPEDIRTLDDLRRLPFSIKADLRDNYPFGLFAVPMGDIVRLHASSGTTGKPIVVGYTRSDIATWAEVMKRAFMCAGLDNNDILQISYGYGLFTGGLGAHGGGEALGCTVVPTSVGNTQRQIMVMHDFGVTAICCTPSYFCHLAEKAAEQGLDMHKMPLRTGIFGAEPWTNEMRKRIEEISGINAFDIYGLSEIIGPGVAIECPEHSGLHVFEDHFYPEVINPDTLEVLPDGEVGELVLTSLTKEALPMIRYRTRDLTRIIPEKCPCGRTLRRIDRISSRSDDMFIIRGINVFPSQIESALLSVDGTLPHYNIVLYTENGMDNIEVDVEITGELFSDRVREIETLQKRITRAVSDTIGLRVAVKLVAPQTIQRSEGKAKRVIDHRNQ
ncbi:MAG: phenylacetate--CoA ligase [Victivallaceae bacterium]|nr:phenylacetate--CoA ligase [Victivallaceae bacterium]